MNGSALGDLLTQHHGPTPHDLPQALRDLVIRLEEPLTISREPTANHVQPQHKAPNRPSQDSEATQSDRLMNP